MRLPRFLAAACFAALTVAALPLVEAPVQSAGFTVISSAQAQPAPAETPVMPGLGPTEVSPGGFMGKLRPYLEEFAGILLTAFLGWVTVQIQRLVGINIEKKHRDALHSAVMTGVSSALNFAQKRAGDITVDVRNKVIADAIKWTETSVPDALAYLKPTMDGLVQIASSKLTILAEAPASIPIGTQPIPPNA